MIGSLLSFVVLGRLENHQFSMPVGRVEYLHLGPMTFDEFLLATGSIAKLDMLAKYSIKDSFDKSLPFFLILHSRRLLCEVKRYDSKLK